MYRNRWRWLPKSGLKLHRGQMMYIFSFLRILNVFFSYWWLGEPRCIASELLVLGWALCLQNGCSVEAKGYDEKSHELLWGDLSLCADKQTLQPIVNPSHLMDTYFVFSDLFVRYFRLRRLLVFWNCFQPLPSGKYCSLKIEVLKVNWILGIMYRTKCWGLPMSDPLSNPPSYLVLISNPPSWMDFPFLFWMGGSKQMECPHLIPVFSPSAAQYLVSWSLLHFIWITWFSDDDSVCKMDALWKQKAWWEKSCTTLKRFISLCW